MTSCDTNILFVAIEATRPGNAAARAFLESQDGNRSFALCELVLIELYMLVRNPAICRKALGGAEAVELIRRLTANPAWMIIDYPGTEAGLPQRLWHLASAAGFPRRRIIDARLALTLRHHGVTDFATANIKDFSEFGFSRVWNPLEV